MTIKTRKQQFVLFIFFDGKFVCWAHNSVSLQFCILFGCVESFSNGISRSLTLFLWRFIVQLLIYERKTINYTALQYDVIECARKRTTDNVEEKRLREKQTSCKHSINILLCLMRCAAKYPTWKREWDAIWRCVCVWIKKKHIPKEHIEQYKFTVNV